MGNSTSIPLPELPSKDFLCVCFYNFCGILLLYPGEEEIKAVREAIDKYWTNGILEQKAKLCDPGIFPPRCYQFLLDGTPFKKGGDTLSSVEIRLMATKILQSLCSLGWKLMVSSDLSQAYDQTTWIFRKFEVEPFPIRFINIGLSSTDTVQLNNCPHEVFENIKHICETISIDGVRKCQRVHEKSYEIKLNGSPWFTTDKYESWSARLMLKAIIENVANMSFTLYANSNLKNTSDTLFFKQTPTLTGHQEYLMISLNKGYSMRLLQAREEVIEAVRRMVRNYWPSGIIEFSDKRPHCYEIKLEGSPWSSRDFESIDARYLLIKIMEELSFLGYHITTGLDLARIPTDKAVLLFKKGEPFPRKYFCVAPSEMNKLRIIAAPEDIVKAAQRVIRQPLFNLIQDELLQGVYKAKFEWTPWLYMRGGYGVYGRVLLLHLLIAFEKCGWRLVCSLDATSRYHKNNNTDYCSDVHSLYFTYDETLFHVRDPIENATAPSKEALGSSDALPVASVPSTAPPLALVDDQLPAYETLVFEQPPPPSYEEVTSWQS